MAGPPSRSSRGWAALTGTGSVGRVRRWALRLLVAYLIVLLVVLLLPSAGPASAAVGWLEAAARAAGAPEALLAPGWVEFAANVAILVPAAAFAALVWPSTTWRDWTAYAFVFSAGVELGQGLFLPLRSATFVDVVANTLGAAVGGVLAYVFARVRSRSASG
jgi:glycopeptide antibiotics resistance protein